MLINIYQSQNVTFIVVSLLPFAFSHQVWFARAAAEVQCILFYLLDQYVSSQMGRSH